MSIEEPYGPLRPPGLTVATWNLWGRHGPWQVRELAIVAALAAAAPDVIALQESWVTAGGETQAERLAAALGYEHWFSAASSLDIDGWGPALAVVSRWPLTRSIHRCLRPVDGLAGWPGEVVACRIEGPQDEIPLINIALDWPPQASALRQASVRQLAQLAKDWSAAETFPIVVCGDFNAAPTSAEVRMLTGLDPPACPGVVLFDAWEKAGEGWGLTWDRANRWAAPTLMPSRRIDYILTGWPSADGGGGDVVAASLLGRPGEGAGVPGSDHYGVCAQLRY